MNKVIFSPGVAYSRVFTKPRQFWSFEVEKELSSCHKLCLSNPYFFRRPLFLTMKFNISKFNIWKVYTIRLQRCSDWQIWVCGKNSVPGNKLLQDNLNYKLTESQNICRICPVVCNFPRIFIIWILSSYIILDLYKNKYTIHKWASLSFFKLVFSVFVCWMGWLHCTVHIAKLPTITN